MTELQNKVEKVASKYADLTELRIDKAIQSMSLSSEELTIVDESIRMLHHAIVALERLARIDGMNQESDSCRQEG